MTDLIVVGSVAIDDVETPTGSVSGVLGGATTYFSLAASAFAKTGIVGVVGEDFPQEGVDLLEARGVDTDGLERAEGKTFRWAGRYHDDINERTSLTTDLNVFENFKPQLPESYKDADFVFLANIQPELQLDVLDQVRSPKFVGMDTMDFWIEGAREPLMKVLARVDAVVINDGEARMLAGTTGTLRAAHAIAEMGPRVVVVKRGEFGAFVYVDGEYFFVPAYPIENVVDPTGAGDCFAGGMFGYLAAQQKFDAQTIRQALVAGSVMASHCVEDFSVRRIGAVTGDEIRARAESFAQITAFEPLNV